MLKKDDVSLMFQRLDTFHNDGILSDEVSIGASAAFYMQGKGVDAFYAELKNKNIQVSEMKLTWYGIKEFYVNDNNGYVLGFAEETVKGTG